MTQTHYQETQYGFEWGPVTVTRLLSDSKGGYLLQISTPSRVMEIRATPHGKKLLIHADREQ